MDFADENHYIYSLTKAFSDKIKNGDSVIFYDADQWIDIIDYYFLEEDEYKLLERAITLSLKQYPTNEELIVRKAEFIAIADYEKALVYLLNSKKELKDRKQIVLLTYQGAQILSREGKHLNALKTAEDCLKYEVNEYILNLAAYQYIKLNEYEKAKDFLLKAFELCYKKYTNSKEEIIKSYGANDYMFSSTVIPDDLLSSTSDLCEKVPKYKKIFFPCVEKFVEYDPQNAYYWEMLSEFYERCNEPNKALNACEYFLCIEPDDIDMLRKKYINYIDSGKKKERIKILKKIAELLEKLQQQKDTPEKKRQELLVSYAMTYKEMINIYLEEEKPKQCLEICEEVLEKNLLFPFLSDKILFSKIYIYHTMSRLYMQLGNQKLAEVYAFKILEIEPENHFAKIAYGELLYFIGQLEKATDVFQNLYEIVEEEIAQIKSNNFLDKGRLQILYTTLTMLISTWVKQLDLLKIPINSSELLKLLIEELLTVDFVERDVFIALSSYAELINSNNYPVTDIKNLIQLAVEIYGPSLLRLLISVPEVYNNKELYSFLENFIKEFDYDEEFD